MTPNERALQDGWAGDLKKPQPAFVHDGAMLGLWKLGLDTFEISKRLSLPQSQIANRLARLRDAGAV